jgi:hypothetical protein
MKEASYRWIALVIFIVGASISSYYRRKADHRSGEQIFPRAEGLPILISLQVFGLALWLGVFAYLINPTWMVWSHF